MGKQVAVVTTQRQVNRVRLNAIRGLASCILCLILGVTLAQGESQASRDLLELLAGKQVITHTLSTDVHELNLCRDGRLVWNLAANGGEAEPFARGIWTLQSDSDAAKLTVKLELSQSFAPSSRKIADTLTLTPNPESTYLWVEAGEPVLLVEAKSCLPWWRRLF